ncbi:hypothetical protein D030_0761B, partial [Vibrio parahaemolyticus AQ3810]
QSAKFQRYILMSLPSLSQRKSFLV